jgi:hypothetical protein
MSLEETKIIVGRLEYINDMNRYHDKADEIDEEAIEDEFRRHLREEEDIKNGKLNADQTREAWNNLMDNELDEQ